MSTHLRSSNPNICLRNKLFVFSMVSHLIRDKCEIFLRQFYRILPKKIAAGIQVNSQQLRYM